MTFTIDILCKYRDPEMGAGWIVKYNEGLATENTLQLNDFILLCASEIWPRLRTWPPNMSFVSFCQLPWTAISLGLFNVLCQSIFDHRGSIDLNPVPYEDKTHAEIEKFYVLSLCKSIDFFFLILLSTSLVLQWSQLYSAVSVTIPWLWTSPALYIISLCGCWNQRPLMWRWQKPTIRKPTAPVLTWHSAIHLSFTVWPLGISLIFVQARLRF